MDIVHEPSATVFRVAVTGRSVSLIYIDDCSRRVLPKVGKFLLNLETKKSVHCCTPKDGSQRIEFILTLLVMMVWKFMV
jgi:regulation of enolase protein 1 (concanavalin A-like superfamily)